MSDFLQTIPRVIQIFLLIVSHVNERLLECLKHGKRVLIIFHYKLFFYSSMNNLFSHIG